MRFFFYGTLLAGSGNPIAAEIHQRLGPLGAASVEGTLHAIPDPLGWYPALVEGEGRVRGIVYEACADFTGADLARLDEYEGWSPADPCGSLYRRTRIAVTKLDGREIEAEGYRFNQPLPDGALAIPDGDFAAFAAARRLAVFAG